MTNDEERFIEYWKDNREKEKSLLRPLITGGTIGLAMGAAIFLCLTSGWYIRANMEANTELNPVVFILAIVAIVIFSAIFYKRYRWEMNEQRYEELSAKKRKEDANKAANVTIKPS